MQRKKKKTKSKTRMKSVCATLIHRNVQKHYFHSMVERIVMVRLCKLTQIHSLSFGRQTDRSQSLGELELSPPTSFQSLVPKEEWREIPF